MYNHGEQTYDGPLCEIVVVVDVVNAHLATMLWTNTKPDPEGSDHNGYFEDDYGPQDATQELAQTIAQDLETCPVELLKEYLQSNSAEQFGHDMSLTRDGHGTGFWDRGLGKLGEALTAWANGLGELHVSDDFTNQVAEQWKGKFHAE